MALVRKWLCPCQKSMWTGISAALIGYRFGQSQQLDRIRFDVGAQADGPLWSIRLVLDIGDECASGSEPGEPRRREGRIPAAAIPRRQLQQSLSVQFETLAHDAHRAVGQEQEILDEGRFAHHQGFEERNVIPADAKEALEVAQVV